MTRSILSSSLLLLLSASSPAFAQPDESGDPVELSEEEKKAKLEEARAYFEIGNELQKQGKFDEAADAYRDAYEAHALPAMIFNVAQAQRLGGKLEEAVASYREYLSLEPKGRGADDARQFIVELTETLERQRKQSEAERKKAEEEARKKAAQEKSKVLTPYKMPEGGQVGGEGTADASKPPPPPPNRGMSGMQIAGLSAAGVGVVALGAGVFFGLDAASAESDLSEFRGEWGPAQEALEKDGEAANSRMILSASVGAALVLVGGGLYLWGGSSDEERPIVSLQLDGNQTGFALSGRF